MTAGPAAPGTAGGAQEAATPGRAACDAFWAAVGAGPSGEQPPDAAWNWAHEANARHAWEAAAGAVMLKAQAAVDYAELVSLREQVAHLSAALAGDNEGVRLWMLDCGALVDKHRQERDAAREHAQSLAEDLDDAGALLEHWPKCPDGCGCRLGTEDADAKECACDGPCCMECRENGYPDAPSYRDLAVKHVMDDLTEATAIIEALREDHGRMNRWRKALEHIATDSIAPMPGKVARAALEAAP